MGPRNLLLAGLVLAGSLEASLAAEARRVLTGQVVSVVDGDTIRVRVGDHIEAVRYIGIIAPEMRHPASGEEEAGARDATVANRSLVDGQPVRLDLDVQERDRYGRLLAYVYLGNLMVNAEMVAQGYAQVMTVPPNVKHQELFLKLQREARLLQIGLWRGTGPGPLPPEPGASPPARSPSQTVQSRPGVPPQDVWSCPLTHSIKGNFTPSSGERCIYHVPGAHYYGKTKPERCYAAEADAVRDGCRRSKL